jgi:hypothetical protein
MATARYSNYYVLSPDGRTYQAFSPNVVRPGESIWIKASVLFPAGTVATDYGILAPVVPGIRPVSGIITASAVNTGLTGTLGYASSAAALGSFTTALETATSTALTVAQITAVTVLPVSGDTLRFTLGGTFTNATTIGVWLQMANLGS